MGERFRYLREEVGSSQLDLAKAAAISVRSVRKIETDKCDSVKIRGMALVGLNKIRLREHQREVQLEKKGDSFRLIVSEPTWLQFPQRKWLRSINGPGALLTADFRVVRFHGAQSLEELKRLVAWCEHADPIGVRIYKGPGGMGKTRLAIELCHRLAAPLTGTWDAGFADLSRFPEKSVPWESLPALRKPILVVVDYAGEKEKTAMVSQLLRHVKACPAPKVRLLFLERDDHWLDRLHGNQEVRDILQGTLLSRAGNEKVHSLKPVASSIAERAESLRLAARAFEKELGLKATAIPHLEVDAKLFHRVLFLHMRALLSVSGGDARSEKAILGLVLARERNYWEKRLAANGLSASLLPVLEAAVFQISVQDGTPDQKSGLELLRKIALCRDQPLVVRLQLFRVLRECYPQQPSGVGPLQPDELKHFFLSNYASEP